MALNFLGNPSADEIQDLQTYLTEKFLNLGRLVVAKQNEIDSLRVTLTGYLASESTLLNRVNSVANNFAYSDYIKTPVDNVEDLDHIESQLYDGVPTANLVDQVTLPYRDVIKAELETIDYKIRKIRYILESKQKELSVLNDAVLNQGVTDG